MSRSVAVCKFCHEYDIPRRDVIGSNCRDGSYFLAAHITQLKELYLAIFNIFSQLCDIVCMYGNCKMFKQ